MLRKFRKWLSVQLSKRPGRVVLSAILILNVIFIVVSAAIINALTPAGTEEMGFWKTAFYTVTMILDAGCIDNVITDIGSAGVGLVITCLLVVVIGMVLFTGAVIGYLTNAISGFIENANLGSHKLRLNGHTVILNWNSRASEIINDLIYCEGKQYVVVLVNAGKERIEKELDERIADTLTQERAQIKREAKKRKGFKRLAYRLSHRFKNNLVVIVREGDTFSTKQLHDIALEKAKSIIILGSDGNDNVCKYETQMLPLAQEKGNPQSIKTLVQVADITSATSSDDDQKIIVEVEDDWTNNLANQIISYKQVAGKCNIIPVTANKILGRLLSQFSLMPELNLAYRELLSNKGMTFYSKPSDITDEEQFTRDYLRTHASAIPLSVLENDGKHYAYFAAGSKKDDGRTSEEKCDFKVDLNYDYWMERKSVIILGHNSKIREIMEGFNSFRNEWNFTDGEIMDVVVIDDEKHLEKMNYFKEYPYVTEAVVADVYDQKVIMQTIERYVDANESDTSVLILSDDAVPPEQIDSGAIANLICVNDIIRRKKEALPEFDLGKIDVIVEILNPKHYDIIKSYSINNVVISNRYVSKMITQLGEKDTLYDFYHDILTYDDGTGEGFESKELYVKKASRFFKALPPSCTAAQLIRAVYEASVDKSLPKKQRNHTMILGYVKPSGEMVLFEGNQNKIYVELSPQDKLIMYSKH